MFSSIAWLPSVTSTSGSSCAVTWPEPGAMRKPASGKWWPPSWESDEMARIAFVTWDGGGNVGPAIGIAQALAARGHRVRFVGYESQRRRLEAQGFSATALERSGAFDGHSASAETRLPALLRWVWACPEHLADIPAALAREPADLGGVDFLMQGAMAWAGRAGGPAARLA